MKFCNGNIRFNVREFRGKILIFPPLETPETNGKTNAKIINSNFSY